jgi:tripartite-type tricarboxylate transporter receptor subunit TctC
MLVLWIASGAYWRSKGAQAFAAFAALCVTQLSYAHADYPERTVTMVVCFPPGGSTDVSARLVNTQLGNALGKPVVIENRGGAGGNIGVSAVKRAEPNGHTLLVCSSAYVVNPSLYSESVYDPLKDFIPIMVLAESPNVFVVPVQSDIRSLPELIEKAKANPGKLNWTSSGVGTTPHLAGEVLRLRTGIEMLHVPFPGAAPAATAALAGQVDVYVAALGSVSGLIASGKLRPIAVTSAQRSPDLPATPTLDESGVKDAESNTFNGVFAPATTPQS